MPTYNQIRTWILSLLALGLLACAGLGGPDSTGVGHDLVGTGYKMRLPDDWQMHTRRSYDSGRIVNALTVASGNPESLGVTAAPHPTAILLFDQLDTTFLAGWMDAPELPQLLDFHRMFHGWEVLEARDSLLFGLEALEVHSVTADGSYQVSLIGLADFSGLGPSGYQLTLDASSRRQLDEMEHVFRDAAASLVSDHAVAPIGDATFVPRRHEGM